jgi:outer membrane protein OmpA-like peptidoglycan-associated protein
MKARILFLAAASALTLAACLNAPPVAMPPLVRSATPPSSAPVASPPQQQTVTAGPLTSAGVGRYMDALELNLRARLRGSGIVVARRADDLLVTFPNARLFVSERLAPSGLGLLASVAQVLRVYDRTLVQVNGYTDTAGSPEQNLDVSQTRATSVGDALTQSGIAAARIEVHGLGGTYLKVVTGDHVSEPRNRRIEIRVVPRPG